MALAVANGAGGQPARPSPEEKTDEFLDSLAWIGGELRSASRASPRPHQAKVLDQSGEAHSQRNTFADSAVNTTITNVSAATSPACAAHPSPFQIPLNSDTA
jgi:hypothetical protein